ncbi:DUF3883 domain-containing protein [Aestuariivivens sediminicola]|uniref:DUF3883 domain-containing protein n=1 Tax=Aestuariivivens sediminicola TaxID=2913560 RepID=UPI001F574F41|nr:DUF3883 domain-containing protein [Aestuariivivens sediminicola]
MNIKLVKSYIEKYKWEFETIHYQEIYKWHAIKQFQENFDIDSVNFYSNVETSLSKSGNLLDSRLYFPKQLLLENIEVSPEQVRDMFRLLYDEDFDLLERIENFRNDFGILSNKVFPEKINHYQDHRAIIVYLTLMYPERYFFYKFGMFKKFAEKIEYAHRPVAGRVENIGLFQNLCELLRFEIEKDQELLTLHENRLDENCYRDKNYNILTQDFIYAVAEHFDSIKSNQDPLAEIISVDEVSSTDLIAKVDEISFRPSIINHIQNNIENKRIGDLGEIWVYKQEKMFLELNGKNNLSKKVKHVAKNKGDGLGYDILSYGLNGNPKYIEVKTTKGSKNSTFYVTRNELEKSIIEKDNYFLYRVYEYNEESEKAKILKIKGPLTNICHTPVNYKVDLKD